MIITGHTARIGKYLQDRWPNAVGVSRSNGFNINDTEELVKLAEDHDVFINCAHGSKWQQADLMLALFQKYRNDNKLFINIGTDAAYTSKWAVVYEQYPIEKAALHAACEHLQNLPHKCRISLIEPNDIKEFDLLDLADAIEFVISHPNIEVKNIRLQGVGK